MLHMTSPLTHCLPLDKLVDEFSALLLRLQDASPDDPSVQSGHALRALLAHALLHLDCSEQWAGLVRRNLEDALAMRQANSSLYRSLPGVGFVIARLAGGVDLADLQESLDPMGRLLAQSVKAAPRVSLDLINGLAGLLVFARAARQEELVDACWERLQTELCLLTPHDAVAWDLGMAHGLPGVLSALAALLQDGWSARGARSLVAQSAQWLWSQCLPIAPDAVDFPYGSRHSPTDQPLRRSRHAWCYGALGVSAAMVRLEHANLSDPAWTDATLRGALNARQSHHGMVDQCLCHGYAGSAYMCLRLAESLSPDSRPRLRADLLAAAWEDHSKVVARLESEPCHATLHVTEGGKHRTDTLLEGSAGVLLAMAGMKHPELRAFEGLLLLDLPVVSSTGPETERPE